MRGRGRAAKRRVAGRRRIPNAYGKRTNERTPAPSRSLYLPSIPLHLFPLLICGLFLHHSFPFSTLHRCVAIATTRSPLSHPHSPPPPTTRAHPQTRAVLSSQPVENFSQVDPPLGTWLFPERQCDTRPFAISKKAIGVSKSASIIEEKNQKINQL